MAKKLVIDPGMGWTRQLRVRTSRVRVQVGVFPSAPCVSPFEPNEGPGDPRRLSFMSKERVHVDTGPSQQATTPCGLGGHRRKPGLALFPRSFSHTATGRMEASFRSIQGMNLNAVILQVRPMADAFYPRRSIPGPGI